VKLSSADDKFCGKTGVPIAVGASSGKLKKTPRKNGGA
jgi:hypothetical protein